MGIWLWQVSVGEVWLKRNVESKSGLEQLNKQFAGGVTGPLNRMA
jgi:hypothetical protein